MLDDLKACPFCGARVDFVSNRDWHRIQGDHSENCPLVDYEFAAPATDAQRLVAAEQWNTRAAPAPAAAEPVGAVYSVHDVGDGKTVTFDLAPGVTLKVGQPLYAEPVPARLQALAGEAADVAQWQARTSPTDTWFNVDESSARRPHSLLEYRPLYTLPAPTQPAVGDDTTRMDWLELHGLIGLDSVTGLADGNCLRKVAASRANVDKARAALTAAGKGE
jgi:hypothetical protein